MNYAACFLSHGSQVILRSDFWLLIFMSFCLGRKTEERKFCPLMILIEGIKGFGAEILNWTCCLYSGSGFSGLAIVNWDVLRTNSKQ